MLENGNMVAFAEDYTFTTLPYLTIEVWGSPDVQCLSEYWVDWIRVRKYADIEPTITIEKAELPIQKPKLKLTIN